MSLVVAIAIAFAVLATFAALAVGFGADSRNLTIDSKPLVPAGLR